MNALPVLAVILHYGDPRSTARLHGQLAAGPGGEVRVLDNFAPVPYPRAWTRLDKNLYWAGALARMLAWPRPKDSTHSWFLNNDITFLRAGALAGYAWHRLRRIEARVGRVAIYSPSVTSWNPYHRHMERLDGGDFRSVSYVDGIAPLISLAYWREAGLDWEGNPLGYGVDVWFSLQASGVWAGACRGTTPWSSATATTKRPALSLAEGSAAMPRSTLSARPSGGETTDKPCTV